jgi:hypothetical protein
MQRRNVVEKFDRGRLHKANDAPIGRRHYVVHQDYFLEGFPNIALYIHISRLRLRSSKKL